MNWDEIRKEWETTKLTVKALAEKHGVKEGTLKSRKSREGWSRGATEKDATKSKKVATPSEKDAPKKRSGNPNPKNQFTKRNTAARKHGLYAKYFSDEQREIMEDFEDFSIADQIYMQIEIKFSAIIRLQKVMNVENEDDHLKVISGESEKSFQGDSTTYKVAFAHERYESYIKAQTRAMAEYRNLVKQFYEITDEFDERRIKLDAMQSNIDRNKAETEKINKDGGSTEPINIQVVNRWADDENNQEE